MTRLALIALATLSLLGGCDKPKPEDCRKALLNMEHLLGTENLSDDATLEGEVRRCRGGSKREAVDCAIKAQTLDQLRACDFYKVPDKKTKGPAGSAAPPAGSVAPAGSAAAPAGSAAAPAGSAAVPAGSAAVPAGSTAVPAGSAN